MADLVAVLQDGRVVQAATPAELYAAPRDLEVATFVGEAVLLDAVLRDDVAECALGALVVRGCAEATGSRGTVVLRPEQVVVGPPGAGVPARVAGVAFFGHDSLVRLDLAGSVPVTARTQGARRLLEDEEVGVTVAGEVSYFPARGQ